MSDCKRFRRHLFTALLCCCSFFSFAQKTITGIVTNTVDKTPISGASVVVKGEKAGVTTDEQGRFSIKASSGQTLVISSVGFTATEVKIGSGSVINVTMEQSVASEKEIVIVGYGTQRKLTVVGAVNTIKREDMLRTPAANITNTLGGRMPGLISLQTTGDPGRDAASLLIRGKSSLTSNNPLVLVDGVERSFNTIDPNEVESISILKDASSTAVFGIRGANGVILVTTRRGTSGKPTISFSTNTALQQVTRLPEFVNSYEYATLKNEGYVNDGRNPFYSPTMLDGYKNHSDPYLYPDVDWMGEFLRNSSLMQQYNLNISGGGGLVKYFVSGSFLSQDGMYKGPDNPLFDWKLRYTRYNFRSNLDFDFTPKARLSVLLGVRNDLRKGPYTDAIGDATSRIFSILMRLPPNMMPVKNPDGSYSTPSNRLDGDVAGVQGMNPLAELTDWGVKKEYTNIVDLSLVYNQKLDNLLRGLAWTTNFSVTNGYDNVVSRYRPVVSGGPINNFFARYPILGKNPDGTYIYGSPGSTVDQPLITYNESNTLADKRWYFETKLNYTGRTGRHGYTALALFNASRSVNATWPRSYMSVTSRVTYDYDSRYLLELNGSYNGSENFAPGNRFGFFPSAALGWIASNERFLQNVKAVNLLKIRASYGKVGSDAGVGRFGFFQFPYSTGGSYSFGLTNGNTIAGVNENRFGNPDIQWEEAQKYNLGIESRFFNGLLGINADVFYELRTKQLITFNTVPSMLGVTGPNLPAGNLGRTENKGFELELTHDNKIGKLDYWAKANVTFARNKILFRDEATPPYEYLRRTGRSLDQSWGLVTDGFFNSQEEIDAWYAKGNTTTFPTKTVSGKLVPGDFKYVDKNGDGVINNDDMVPVGSPVYPEYFFGFSFGGNIGKFDFSTLFQGATNASMYVAQEAGWAFFNAGKALKEHLDRWTPENKDATYPRLSASPATGDYNYVSNDFWLKDASYIRLKQVQLGFKFGQSLVRKIGGSSARIYLSGANLLTWSAIKYLDPENRNSRAWFYPQQRVYNLGFNINF